MLSFMSRMLKVNVGVGSWSNLFCIVELGARFWHIRVSLTLVTSLTLKWPIFILNDAYMVLFSALMI